MRFRTFFSALVISTVGATHLRGEVYVTGNNGGPIPTNSYTVVQLPNGNYDVYLTELWQPWVDTFFEVRGNAGDIIEYANVIRSLRRSVTETARLGRLTSVRITP